MNIFDVVIILIILGFMFLGFKRGFTKELVSFLGFFIIIILSFVLKNPVSIFLYSNLPFFKFMGIFEGISTLNIFIYEVIAFFLVFLILNIILKLLTFLTSIFEKFLKMTIILGIPSKILGGIVGIIEGFTIAFLVVYVLNLPIFNIKEIENSKLKDSILNNTPLFSNLIKNSADAIEDFTLLEDEYNYDKKMDSDDFNLKTLDLLLKYNIISVDSVQKLQKQGKLNIPNIDKVLKNYKED